MIEITIKNFIDKPFSQRSLEEKRKTVEKLQSDMKNVKGIVSGNGKKINRSFKTINNSR